MSLAKVNSRAELGLDSPLVEVEVDIGSGLPQTTMVGLPAATVKEAKDRVRSALRNSGFSMPDGHITVNLAPADLPKHGTRFDLAIAIGIVAANEKLQEARLENFEFVGELALDGRVRAVGGVLPAALRARAAGRTLIVAAGDTVEAGLASDCDIVGAQWLRDVCNHLAGLAPLPAYHPEIARAPARYDTDLVDVCGQQRARRALEIAAAGHHHLLLRGSPGTGKTMLATRLPTILPPLSEHQALEAASVASVAKIRLDPDHFGLRPFRAPHHTASAAAVIGGGSHPRPGEISLAHQGVLFLDELPEFSRRVLEALREPLESRTVVISRAELKIEYPAAFQLVAAMNPCPCGYAGDVSGRCSCTPDQIERYTQRISGPLLDRLDLHVETEDRPLDEFEGVRPEDSATVRQRVAGALQRQCDRQGYPNGRLPPMRALGFAGLAAAERKLLRAAIDRLGLSMRAYDKVIRVALTVADLQGHDRVEGEMLTEALSYRQLDRRWR